MQNHLVEWLGKFSNLVSIINLHFTDDTLLFLKADKKVLEHVKWLLLAFENSSGLKINYSKVRCILLISLNWKLKIYQV